MGVVLLQGGVLAFRGEVFGDLERAIVAANLDGGPRERLAWTLYVTQAVKAAAYGTLLELRKYYEAHPEAPRPANYAPNSDPPQDLASLLATRPQQAAALRLISPVLSTGKTEPNLALEEMLKARASSRSMPGASSRSGLA